MNRFQKVLSLSLAAVLLVCLLPLGAMADTQQTATTEVQDIQEGTSQELLDAVMDTNPEDAGVPILQEPEHPQTPYTKEFTYTEDVLLSGIFDTNQFYFRVRPYWGTQYAYARIQFTLSQLIGDGPASLTFSVNNKPVYSCKVAYTDGQQQILYVPIPVSLLNIGYNSFGVTGYVRS